MTERKQSGVVLVTSDLVSVENMAELVLAVTNRRYGGFCLPGGKVDPGETPRDAAVRELWEETGLRILESDLVWLFAGDSATESGREVHVFWARVASGNPQTVEENTVVQWLTLDDLKASKPFGPFYKKHFPDGVSHFRATAFR